MRIHRALFCAGCSNSSCCQIILGGWTVRECAEGPPAHAAKPLCQISKPSITARFCVWSLLLLLKMAAELTGGGAATSRLALQVPLPAVSLQEALRASTHLAKGKELNDFELSRHDVPALSLFLEAADFLGAPQLTAAVYRCLETPPDTTSTIDLGRVPSSAKPIIEAFMSNV